MKKWIALLAAAVMIVCALAPSASFTEDRDTVLLARAIYALARDEDYDVKLAIGTVAMNRVENPWFDAALSGVLNAQHQFPIGRRYDRESLAAAHAVLAGTRTLPDEALYYRPLDAAQPWRQPPLSTIGNFNFYTFDETL